jgi:hypothetical protein
VRDYDMEKWVLIFIILGGKEEHVVGVYDTKGECDTMMNSAAQSIIDRKRLQFMSFCLPEDIYTSTRVVTR